MAAEETLEQSRSCEVCSAEDGRYRCPRCSIRSCSLGCSKRHKADTGCSGKRDRTAFVPLAHFEEADLRSDFFLLEGAHRAKEAARRSSLKDSSARASHSQPHDLIREAHRRGIDLRLQPPGMKRRQDNSTCFYRHKQCLSWHLEWHFPAAEERPVLHSRAVSERETLGTLLAGHLSPGPGQAAKLHALRAYVDSPQATLRVLLRRAGCPAHQPQYYLLAQDRSLSNLLAGKRIIEWPVLHVVLQQDLHAYTLVPDAAAEPRQVQPALPPHLPQSIPV